MNHFKMSRKMVTSNVRTIRLPALHPAQLAVSQTTRRFNVLDCGRRFGKSLYGLNLAVDVLLAGAPVGVFASRYRDVSEWWRELTKVLRPVQQDISQQEKRLEIITGGVIEVWSLEDPDAGRSRKYQRVIIDEAAKARYLQRAWEESIRPTLTDFRGDAFFLSTPKGHNYFKRLYDFGQDPSRTDWVSWMYPTISNPYISTEEVEAARLELPERVFRQEYLAEFIDGANLFRNVRECAVEPPLLKREDGHNYVFGVDWAKVNDFTVITVWDIEEQRMVYLERFNQIDYNIQGGRLKSLNQRFKPSLILAESNSIGEPMIDHLRSEGLPITGFNTSSISKARIVNKLTLALEEKSIRLQDDPNLIRELEAFQVDQLPSGNFKYGAPQGEHDDIVMATCIGLEAMTSIPQPEYIAHNPIYG